MTKKSDFAQKLLDDLRLRKEQLVTPQSSNQAPADKYRNFRQPSQGSIELNPLNTLLQIGTIAKDKQKGFGNGNRSFLLGESSKEIVPVGRARNSENITDLSNALVFALENGRNMGKMEYSSTPIKEISRGAQKLNQILKACYNGASFEKYSVNIGKELLKGAVDLEGSLRILASLQGTSEYTVCPRKKYQITLTEIEDDDKDIPAVKINKHKQLGAPRFSFDTQSRNSSENGGFTKTNRHKQPLLAITYSAEATHLASENKSSSIVAISSPKSHSDSSSSHQEKRRISNVVAKLMGLEQLSAKTEVSIGVQSDQIIKQGKKIGTESNRVLKENIRQVERVRIQSEKSGVANKISTAPEIKRNYTTPDSTLERVVHIGKPNYTRPKNAGDVSSKNLTLTNIPGLHQSTETPMEKQEQKRRQENISPTERRMRRVETKESIIKGNLERMENKLRVGVRAQTKEIAPKKVTKRELQLPFQKPKSLDAKLQEVRRHRQRENVSTKLQLKQQNGKGEIVATKKQQDNLQVLKQVKVGKEASREAFEAIPSKHFLKRNHHEDLTMEENSTNLKLSRKKSTSENIDKQKPPAKDEESIAAPVVLVTITKTLHVPHMLEDADNLQLQKGGNQKTGEVMITKGASTCRMVVNPLEQQISILQELKQRRHNRIKSQEAEISIDRTREPEDAITQPLNLIKQLPENEDFTTMLGKESEISPPSSTTQVLNTEVSDSLQNSIILLNRNQAPKSSDITLIQSKGMQEPSIASISRPLTKGQKKIPQSEIKGSLNKTENQLKQILVTSQLFLNATGALFRLQIPAGILLASAQIFEDEKNKLILDCSYEVMKRKGRRRELTSYGSANVKCFDDLVKEVNVDIETLQLSATYWENELDGEKCLQRMLEKDIQDRNLDVNCMWDSGWSDTMLGYLERDEVVKDVEKFVLNILIDEIILRILTHRHSAQL
ncbi:hypothetical protein GIB67_005500 [Kingdonia uniflora]|uniref:DUF4378 domain-containing protein n=1 Tax=Kingdonia uniflora TaxID=39325 RepID=A0A7J7NIB1_9MAGN|nr:hypothetical protein GIB67_005500 [Kingdonia uniflora]